MSLKTEGAHASISLPAAVVHTNNFTADDFDWVENSFEKRGGLYIRKNNKWKEYWFVLRKGTLAYYDDPQDVVAIQQINLKNSTIEEDTTLGRTFCFHVTTTVPVKDNYYLSANTKESYEEWMVALCISGAANAAYVKKDLAAQEKKRGEERKQREKKEREAEEEYIRNKRNASDELQRRKQRQKEEIQSTDRVNCICEFKTITVVEKEGKLQFTVEVTFGNQIWTIYRYDKQFSEFYAALLSADFSIVRNQLPRRPSRLDATMVKVVCSQMDTFLMLVANDRRKIFGDRKLTRFFTRFIAPVQLGDKKSEDFAIPFRIELL